MRLVPILLLVSFLAPLASSVSTPALTTLSIAGPSLAGENIATLFQGTFSLEAVGSTGRGLGGIPGQQVVLIENGAALGTATTDARGTWTLSIGLQGRGLHRVSAVAAAGTAIEARSREIVVNVAVPPTAPLGVQATLLSGANVTVGWSPPADNGGATVQGYRVDRLDGAVWTLVATVSGGIRSVVTPVYADGDYRYRVRAVNLAGSGNASEAVATVDLQPPSAPRAFASTARPDLRVVDLSWDAPEVIGSGPVASYRIERSLDGVAWSLRQMVGAAVRAYNESVPSDDTYQYRIRASNAFDTGAPALAVVLVDMLPPSEPLSVVVEQVPLRREFTISWAAPAFQGSGGTTGFQVERSTLGNPWSLVGSTPSGARSLVDAVPADGEYSYRVVAIGAFERGGPSAEVTGRVDMLPPGAPVGVSALQRSQAWVIDIKWAAPEDVGAGPVDRYIVERDAGAGWSEVALVNGSTLSYADPIVDGVYVYRVRAATPYEVGPASASTAPVDVIAPDSIDHRIVAAYTCDGFQQCTRVAQGGVGYGGGVWVDFEGEVVVAEAPIPAGSRVQTFTNITFSCGSGCTREVFGGVGVYADANGHYEGHKTAIQEWDGCGRVTIRSSAHYAGVSSPVRLMSFTMCS